MEEVERLEAAVGKKVEQWNAQDLGVLTEDPNAGLLQYFKNPVVLNECIERSKSNKDVEDILYPLSVKMLLTAAEQKGNDILVEFEKKEIDEKGLISECEAMIGKSDNYYDHLAAYLILASKCPDYDLRAYEGKIKTDIAALKETVCLFGSEQSLLSLYSLVSDLLELVFPLRTRYYSRYSVDILDDSDKRLEGVLDLMDKIGEEALKASQAAAGKPEAGKADEAKPEGDKKE